MYSKRPECNQTDVPEPLKSKSDNQAFAVLIALAVGFFLIAGVVVWWLWG